MEKIERTPEAELNFWGTDRMYGSYLVKVMGKIGKNRLILPSERGKVATRRNLVDFDFDVLSVHKSWRSRAMLRAVCAPILRRKWPGIGVPAALARIRKIWRMRVLALRDVEGKHDYHPFADMNFQGARNCPPFGVKTKETAFTCDHPMVCPFCWGRRYASRAFHHLEGLADDVPEDVERVLVTRTFVYPSRAWSNRVCDDFDARERRRLVNQIRYRYGDFFLGGFQLYRPDIDRDGMFFVERAVVFAIELDGFSLDDLERDGWQEFPMTRRALCTVIGRTCRYPVGVLFSKRADKVAYLLQSLKHRQLISLHAGSACSRPDPRPR